MKYKRYIKFAIIFMFIFILIFICLHFLSKGYTSEYKIDDKYKIKEIYTKDEQKEHDNYYLEIGVSDLKFNYQFYIDVDKNNKLVSDIIYYDGETKCMMPIFKNGIKVDFLCYKDQKLYNYYDIKGQDEKLDNYISKLDKNKYNIDDFKDNKKNKTEVEKIGYFKNNIPKDYVITLTTLKGIATINDNIEFKELFDSDIYKRDLSIFDKNYYITADYSNKQDFRKFYVVDLNNGKEKILTAPDYISFDAYIQGVVDNCVYIYDINNEKQYKLNLDESLITEVGNNKSGIRYYNGKWTFISTVRAKNYVLFKNNDEVENNYKYFYKDGNKLSGFYYYFDEVDDKYEVYRANVQNKKIKKYLFTVKDYDDVIFEEDYVFYKEDDTIKMYSDYTGIKTVVQNSELEFNENILFNVYKK